LGCFILGLVLMDNIIRDVCGWVIVLWSCSVKRLHPFSSLAHFLQNIYWSHVYKMVWFFFNCSNLIFWRASISTSHLSISSVSIFRAPAACNNCTLQEHSFISHICAHFHLQNVCLATPVWFHNSFFFMGWSCKPCIKPPNLEDQGIPFCLDHYLWLVQHVMPASSCATTSISLRVIWPSM
jgi:hypothetical protein